MHNILIIGGGNMGQAYACSLLEEGLTTALNLSMVERDLQQIKRLKKRFGCSVYKDIPPDLKKYKVVILAVKPQDMRELCAKIKGLVNRRSIVISVMAGIKCKSLLNAIGNIKLVRCMPNLPSSLKMGVTAYYIATPLVANLKGYVLKILASTGALVKLDDETLLDSATAVSGSGPAYVFYLIENLLLAATRLGFNPTQAQELVYHTLVGSAVLWKRSGESAKLLRERVTSKKGTTFAAFKVFTKHKVGKNLQSGIIAAHKRAKELANS